ncbi:thioredoxin family protein [Flavobacterium plurextorum]|uniref:VPGUxxT family thioredoxin-like (seleno)protein, type 2 n=1 Tax=Flavobacterium TaxID=237 RepID=UPI00214D4859|nr:MULTISPECIES: VPGUxxT family thioredoxin-like (seleno)protein, type 2 [Flavobacterium]UUW08735.1 thioredoxin family protein [Flavobacterium plurextorum]
METRTNSRNQNIELGRVSWLRDYDEALRQSELTGKPVILFFQEIPGCSTCVNFGRDVLSHPLMVEFIENEFIPLAIFNNIPGKDSDILDLYNEPSWNNPVAHFVDGLGSGIIPKLANNYHPLGMYNKLIEALEVSGKPVPKYAALLGEDLKMKYGKLNNTIYETPCFWSGETSLALHPAVKYTEAGKVGIAEAVTVYFDNSQVTLEQLNSYAAEEGFFQIDSHENYRIDKSPQYYLAKSYFKYLPLSKAQRAQINVAIPYKKEPMEYLSPKQVVMYHNILKGTDSRNNERNYIEDIENSWDWTL